MPRLFKRCLAIINTRSGSRDGRSIFASALQQYLDRAGIIHRDVHVPEHDTVEAIRSSIKDSECVVVCGGDGTVSSVVNVLATAAQADLSNRARTSSHTDPAADPATLFLRRPLLVVPAGMQNSIAHSLGIQSAERAVSAFVMGRQEAVPLWEVRLNGALARYMCSYVAVGSYAEVVRRFHALDAVGDEYVALPMLTSKFSAAALYTSLTSAQYPCSVELTSKPPSLTAAPENASSPSPSSAHTTHTVGATTCTYKAPIRMLLAAQMPLQHGSYSLCPDASFKSGTLAATVATTEASRLRLWHLFRREAAEGYVLDEDGVHTHRQLTSLCVRRPSEAPSEARDRRRGGDSDIDDVASGEGVLVSLDGELLRLSPGSELTVHRAPFDLPFLIC